jgi:alkylation response protein AidB-like acyl-CoA dehydrogenase
VEFDLSPDQKLFRGTTRDFLEKEMPLTRVRELAGAGLGFERDWWRRGAELGWTSMLVPPDLGGGSISGAGLLDMCIVAEQMGRLVTPGPLVATNIVAAALSSAENAAEHAGPIEAIVAGEAVASWAVCEPGRNMAALAPAVQAVRDGGGYLLSGVKDRVESGDQADFFLVTANTADGPAQFVLPSDAPGVTVAGQRSIDLVRRYARVSFDGVRLDSASLVSAPGTAEQAISRQWQLAVVLQAAETAGVIDRVFEFTVQWAFDRYSFGRPLASYQALKHRFADMKMWLEACQATASAAAHAVADGAGDAAELASVAKSYIGPRATDLIQDCVQLHGGIGVTWEHDIHLYLRRATANRATWGTPNEHRQHLAGLLGV